jgi:hypothetical protein
MRLIMLLQNIFREGRVGLPNCDLQVYLQVRDFVKYLQNLRNLGEVRTENYDKLPMGGYI